MAVASLTPGSSAERCEEVQIGDQLVEVNHVYVYRGRIDSVRQLMLGPAGTRVPLKLRRIERQLMLGPAGTRVPLKLRRIERQLMLGPAGTRVPLKLRRIEWIIVVIVQRRGS
ncbi:hypothetical protein T484DRAFT_1797718 [Baffinella frigidus]|nr:hypothetical protein T484DRAFT_1797718 [Cryptophyta sp. CCMP2293]